MKRFLLSSAILTVLLAGCGKEYDDSMLKDRVDTLEEQVQANTEAIKALQNKLEDAAQKGLTVTVTPVTGGNKLTFSDGTSITVMDGVDGAQGPQGPKGDDGDDAVVSIKESADGTAYIITFNDKEYSIRKGQFFALQVEATELGLAPEQSVEIAYTLTEADASVKVFVSAASGYKATVDQDTKKVTLTAPAELPESGYVVITAVKNSTGEESSQYIKFSLGKLDVTADAETVEAEGGLVTLTVEADCEYTVRIPEDCTWIRQVEKKSIVTSYVYLEVDENQDSKTRTAEIRLISAAGINTVAIVQKGGSSLVVSSANAAERLAEIAAMPAAELNGKTIIFEAGEYTTGLTLTMEEAIALTITGEDAVFATGGAVLNLTNVNATISDLTFDGCKQPVKINGGKSTITGCTFKNNDQGSGNGGAIYMEGSAELEVKGCTFNGNKAKFGADIYMVDGNLTVDNCQFAETVATYGGACLAMNSATNTGSYSNIKAVVKNSTFTNIKTGTALTDGANDAPCGVISCVHGDITVDGCTFDGCEGKVGTIVALSSRPSRWDYKRGNSFLKMNNCMVKNSSVVMRGLIVLYGDAWGDNPGVRDVAFINNTTFTNTTSSTGNFGIVAHSDGSAGIMMFNNCTFYGDTLPASAGNGYTLSTEGFILVSNSTFVSETIEGFFRNGNDQGAVKVINTIAINTKEGADDSVVGEPGKPISTDGHCIYGPGNDEEADLTDPIKNATTASLAGYAWDATTGLVTWNGPAEDFDKLESSEFQTLLTGFGPKTPLFYDEASAGEAFYNWLVEIGAVGKDARGESRGTSWWPGAYQN